MFKESHAYYTSIGWGETISMWILCKTIHQAVSVGAASSYACADRRTKVSLWLLPQSVSYFNPFPNQTMKINVKNVFFYYQGTDFPNFAFS